MSISSTTSSLVDAGPAFPGWGRKSTENGCVTRKEEAVMPCTRNIQEAAEPYDEKTQEVAGTESRDQSGSTQEAAKALYRRKPCLDRSVRRHRWFSGSQVVCFFLLGFCPGVVRASSPETLFRTSWSYSCNYCPSGCPSSCFPTDVFDYNTVAWSGWDNFTNEAMVPVPCLHDRVCVAGLPAVHTSLFPSLLKSLHVGLPIMYGASVLLTCCAAMWVVLV